MNEVHIDQTVVGKWRVGGELRVQSDLLSMLCVCNLNIQGYYMRMCLCLFQCVERRHWCGGRRQSAEIMAVLMGNLRGSLSIRRIHNIVWSNEEGG